MEIEEIFRSRSTVPILKILLSIASTLFVNAIDYMEKNFFVNEIVSSGFTNPIFKILLSKGSRITCECRELFTSPKHDKSS